MKKIIVVVGLIVSICLLGIGIFGLSAKLMEGNKVEVEEDVKSKVRDGLQKLKSAQNLTWNMELITEVEEEKASTMIKLNSLTNESEVVMTIANQEMLHSYTVLEEEKLVSYTYTALLGNKWVKSIDEENTMNYDSSYFDIILEQVDYTEKIMDNFYQIIIPKEKAKDLLNENNEEETQEEIIADVPVKIMFDTNGITTVQIDFSSCIKKEEKVITKYVITNSYRDIGNTVVSVPVEIKNNAVNGDELF